MGQAIFEPLKSYDGGYVNADVGGYQILLNYRGKPCKLGNSCSFTLVSMRDILEDKIPRDLMRDKLVLIGVTATSISDLFYNPYSYNDSTRITGVEIHAHLTSQIINAALKGNYLIKTIPQLGEWIWIFSWSTVSSILALRSFKKRAVAISIFIISCC